MNNSHTPGPWEYARTDQFDQSLDIFESKTARTLARTINTLPIEEAEANARLIAAAPDLLKALKLAAQELDIAANYLCDLNIQAAENCTQRAVEARAAIAKAEGQP